MSEIHAQEARTEPVDTGWLLLVVVATYPVLQFVRRVVDTSITVVDEAGTTHFVSDGRATSLVQLVIGGLIIALAGHVTMRAHRAGSLGMNVWALTAFVFLVCDVLRSDPDPVVLVSSGVASVALLCMGFGPLTGRSLSRVGYVTGAVAASLVLFAVVSPAEGFDACRPDKCSIAGGFLRGYFPQENVVALFLVALLPTVAFIGPRLIRNAVLTLVVVSVLMTGSRTSMAAMVFALLAVVLIRRRADPARAHGDSAKVLALVPLLSFAASVITVFLVSGLSLTGRGYIFEIVRDAWVESPLLGPGREVVTEAYSRSQAWWYIAHEHGQGAYVLAQSGIVGGALFLACLMVLILACWRSRGPVPALFALVPAIGFQTEPVWEFTLSSPFIASLVITATLTTQALGRDPLPRPVPARSAPDTRPSRISDSVVR